MIKYQILYKHNSDTYSSSILLSSHIDLNQAYKEVDYQYRLSTRQSFWIEEIIVNSIYNEHLINLTLNNPFDIYQNCVIENCKIINGSFFNCILDQNIIDIDFTKPSIKWK